MSGGKKPFMDVLGLSEEEEDSSSSSEAEEEKPAKKSKQPKIDVATLMEHGYQGGLSVLLVPEKQDEGEANWAWSSGVERRQDQPPEETFEEREANRAAVTVGAEASAAYARKAQEQAQRLREEKHAEKQRLKHDKNLTYNQKEKRKREQGKVSRGGSYVEEEKRRAREFGIISGFD